MTKLSDREAEDFGQITRMSKAITAAMKDPDHPERINVEFALAALASSLVNLSLIIADGDHAAAEKFLLGMIPEAMADARDSGIPERIARKGGRDAFVSVEVVEK